MSPIAADNPIPPAASALRPGGAGPLSPRDGGTSGKASNGPIRRPQFNQIMLRTGGGPDSRGGRVRDAAEELVSRAFVLPMLKMHRDSALRSELLHGGQGEKAFGSQLDQKLAKRVTEALGPSLVDAVYEQFAGPTGGKVDRDG